LHHLNKSDEVLGWHLISLHNIHFYHQLMAEMRASILENRFLDYYQNKREELVRTDEDNPATPYIGPKKSRAEKRASLGDYEVHISPKGFSSIRQKSSGEIMHSVNAPAEEASTLYVEPTGIERRLSLKNELVIWDVGLGGASNVMGVIEALAEVDRTGKKVVIESFEIDLDPLRLALRNPQHFPHIRHPAPHVLLRDHHWSSPDGSIEWVLREGDFAREYPKARKPDVIYYDPFSSKTDTGLWTRSLFQQLKEFSGPQPFTLLTYSAATRVRSALLAAGLFVGKGAATGPKSETTIAYHHFPEEPADLLDLEWLRRWERSDARYPTGLSEKDQKEWNEAVRGHPQFKLI
jgi:queuine tRNA-ribosyltransferase